MEIFKNIPLYIKLYKNRIEICRLDTEKCKEIKSQFSSSRILFADYEKAEFEMKKIIKSLISERLFFAPSLTIAIQQLEMNEGGLSSVEKRAIIDSCEQLNSKKTKIIEVNYEISLSHALSILNEK